MRNVLALLKNKNVLIAVATSLAILILVIIFSPKKSVSPSTSSETPSGVSQLRGAITNFRVENAPKTSFDLALESKLPLYLESFPTSVDIATSINIYRTEGDPSKTIHVEIFGLSYLNGDTNAQKNPNVTAFAESYLKAIEMIEGVNVDPRELTFIYSDEEYLQENATLWVNTLKLNQ